MRELTSIGLLKMLEGSSKRGLGPGNLGVLISRAGVGKTACLIHIAFNKIFSRKKIVHISLEEGPEKVISYYNVIYHDLAKALKYTDDYDEDRALIDGNRIIQAYLNDSFEVERLRINLNNLADQLDFRPETLIVDGLDFEETERKIFEGLKEIAEELNVEIWCSALSHRHIPEVNERGIPHPCRQLDDLFSLIIQLQSEPSGTFLQLLKDHYSTRDTESTIRLDPNTFLAMD